MDDDDETAVLSENEDDSEDDSEDDESEDDDDAPSIHAPARKKIRRPPATRQNESHPRVAARASSPGGAGAIELFDITLWPGTAEAARQVGKHPSTIKQWRTTGKVRAQQDEAGCWRHHPDDLVEMMTGDGEGTPMDGGAVLAAGMTAIVTQGASANERLLAMTEIATKGLESATGVISRELERAYEEVARLQKENTELRGRLATDRASELDHERRVLKMRQKHELDVTGAKESSERLMGLLSVLAPVAASMAARFLGKENEAQAAERAALAASPMGSAAAPGTPAAAPTERVPGPVLVSIESRIADAMARLARAIHDLDEEPFRGLRAMVPSDVASALDAIRSTTADEQVRGAALAHVCTAAQNLSDQHFAALKPIAPAVVGQVLGELRVLLRDDPDDPPPTPRVVQHPHPQPGASS